MDDIHITPKEWKAILGLSTIFSLRMLGMFMVLPVLNTYGILLTDASETLIGIAIGIYGLTQALFQIPCGLLSDLIGRKTVIVIGLLLFALGSAIAGIANSIWGVILGRSLQGSGAISAAIMALLSDLTQEQNRTLAMAYIGISFGITFTIAMITGPIITQAIGLSGLFWIIALMALSGIMVTLFFIPNPNHQVLNRDSNVIQSNFGVVLTNSYLMKLNFSIMCLHTLLISSFIAIPPLMEKAGLSRHNQWQVYIVTMLIALVCVVPLIFYAEKYRYIKQIFRICILLMLFAEVIFWYVDTNLYGIFLGIQLFFISFNIIEALLPSILSKVSPTGYKGTAMGIYSTSQFIGVAIGGSIGGLLYEHNGANMVFTSCAVLTAIWLLISLTMKQPIYLSNLRIVIPKEIRATYQLEKLIKNLHGVVDVVLIPEEQTIYMKIDSKLISRSQIELFISSSEHSEIKFKE
ncbi:MFS transporter [Candidatus Profftia sp. (ex Adelges kitamiensis)]|uniref:MFS transporter n=1 Tax=Candidatus Profftia sp. (ex Adelges kitamiensis) TaxID=2864218 RepID=UPI001CE256AE|nr:MFS transporter [Candidatus Profftia sp. (ex Adelges kitamiensis)]